MTNCVKLLGRGDDARSLRQRWQGADLLRRPALLNGEVPVTGLGYPGIMRRPELRFAAILSAFTALGVTLLEAEEAPACLAECDKAQKACTALQGSRLHDIACGVLGLKCIEECRRKTRHGDDEKVN